MPNNITPFFATQNDLGQLLERVSLLHKIKFVRSDLFDSQAIYEEVVLIQDSSSVNYLISHKDEKINSIRIPQRDGTVKFAIDQRANAKTIAINPGGFYEKSCLVAGQVGTISNDPDSKKLYGAITSEMRKQFTQIKSYLVGPEASLLLDKGCRLMPNPKSAPLYDLTRT